MGNIIDYVKWRGDLTFAVDPFNEVDNLIFSYLSYVNLDGVAPIEGEELLTITEISEKFFAMHSEEELQKDKSFIRLAPDMLKEMAGTRRYGDLLAGNYLNHINIEENLQFSAIEIVLPDESSYLAIRGTDDRIVGWKEDFLMASGEVAAQTEAVEYVNRCGKNRPRIRIGGHSKGGHLAVYAGAFCETEVQNRIVKVYNNDGPGFRKDFLESKELANIVRRIVRIVPEHSIVGMLLGHVTTPIVIQSNAVGVMQHDGLSWQVLGPRFETVPELSKTAVILDQSMDQWLQNYNDEERNHFINDFFSVLEAPGVETLTELQNGGVKALAAMWKRRETLAPETKEKIDLLLQTILMHWTDFVPDFLKK
ncbi:MAG: DUF2974 domain-containing protein [Eubacteriales bacterium]|nr:DUF2974 domain-containing protein [Eubacteriales bacterium]